MPSLISTSSSLKKNSFKQQQATDCGAIDAVLVTSAAGLLGLPYLVQAAAEAVGGQRAVSAGDPRAGGVMPSSGDENYSKSSASSSSSPSSRPLPPFLDPPFEVFATDLAVDMALAWIAELGASSSAAADAEADDCGKDDDEERRGSGIRSSSSRPLADLPASALASLTERARRDILGTAAAPAEGGGKGDEKAGLKAWRRAYPAALASALLSGGDNSDVVVVGGGKNDKSDRNGNGPSSSIKGRVVTRVQYGERVRLRGGRLLAVASAAGGPSPGGAVWTLVDSVAEGAASLPACSGRVAGGGGDGGGGAGSREESGVARVVCVGAVGGVASYSSSSSSAAAPLDVAALRGAHVLVLAPPEDPPPPPPLPRPLPLLCSPLEGEKASVAAAAGPSPSSAAAAAAVAAIERGGNALLPIAAGDGRALELVEAVLSSLYARGGHGLLSRVPCVFASPGAKRATAASCSSAEWLCAARSALVLSGRAPYFAGAAASAAASVVGGGGGSGGGGGNEQNASAAAAATVASRRANGGGGGLFVADSLSDARRRHGWKEPCVALVPVSSLFNSGGGGSASGGGDGAALLRAWGGDPRSAVVFTSSSPPLPSGARLSQLVSAAFPGIKARLVDVEAEAAEAPANAASALSSLVAAVAPGVLVVPRKWERAMLRESGSSTALPLGKACGRIEALDALVPLELAEGEDDDDEEEEDGAAAAALPRALSLAGVTSELASAAASKGIAGPPGSRLLAPRVLLLALATVRDGEIELDAPPGAAGGAALAAALVRAKEKKNKKRRKTTTAEGEEEAVAPSPSSTLDALLCKLGAPAVEVE